MKVLILYCSGKGFIREAAERLRAGLGEDVVLCDLKRGRKERPDAYEGIVLAGAYHAGKLSRKLRSYMNEHTAVLEEKKTAFLLGGMDREHYKEVFVKNVPPALTGMDLYYAGGRYLPEDHNPLMRRMMASITGEPGAVHQERWEVIDELIESLRQMGRS